MTSVSEVVEKSIPGGEKRRQQFVGVVDLAIVDDRAGAFPILPDYGLTAARNIADAESGVGKPPCVSK